MVGVNSRLDSIQAAILDQKLKHLDTYNANRINAADLYDTHFKGVDRPGDTVAFWQLSARLPPIHIAPDRWPRQARFRT